MLVGLNMEKGLMPKRWFYGHSYSGDMMSISYQYEKPRELKEGERYLGNFIIPPFQRGLVWSLEQKQKLIHSIYVGLPIGSIVWNLNDSFYDTDWWLLDGQQRVSTIISYMNGEFEFCGYRYPDLPKEEQAHFRRMPLSKIQTKITDPKVCEEIYNILIYGGTPHE